VIFRFLVMATQTNRAAFKAMTDRLRLIFELLKDNIAHWEQHGGKNTHAAP